MTCAMSCKVSEFRSLHCDSRWAQSVAKLELTWLQRVVTGRPLFLHYFLRHRQLAKARPDVALMEVWDRGTPPDDPASVDRYGVDCGVKQLLLSELGVHFYELLKTRRAGAGDKEAWASLLLALAARYVFNTQPLIISDAAVAASGHHRFDVQEAGLAYVESPSAQTLFGLAHVEAPSAQTLSCRLREPLAFELAHSLSLRLQTKHSDVWRLLLRLNKYKTDCKATVSCARGVLRGASLSCCCGLLSCSALHT